jgi:transposase
MSPADLIQATRDELVDTCVQQAEKIGHLEAENQWLKEQFRLARHRQFGPSSEQTSPEQQALVFNEAEAEAVPTAPEPTVETITYQRRKTKGQREARLKHLPVETIEHRLSADEQICTCCGGPLRELEGMEAVRQELKIVPAQVTLVKHVRATYGCRQCEQAANGRPIQTAPMPTPAFPGSLASPSAVAYIISQKFVEGLPLYRQEQNLARLGVLLSRQTLANWTLAGADLLTPVYEELHDRLLERHFLHADETTLQVLREPGRAATTNSYLWLYRTGRDGPPIILYDYQETRAGAHPTAFLAGFTGFLHVDGYQGYVSVPGVTLVGCWAHARRYFTDALTALPASARAAGLPPPTAQVGLDFCNRLFAIERELRDATPEARHAARLQRSRPVLNAFQAWLANQAARVLPKSALGQAITYCTNQWAKLIVFLKDGRLELDNNRSERAIKPVVIGRKNWLFANTPKGATASAILYSLVETAKANGLSPYAYLTYLFERLPDTTTSQLDALLPWSPTLPDACRVPVVE